MPPMWKVPLRAIGVAHHRCPQKRGVGQATPALLDWQGKKRKGYVGARQIFRGRYPTCWGQLAVLLDHCVA